MLLGIFKLNLLIYSLVESLEYSGGNDLAAQLANTIRDDNNHDSKQDVSVDEEYDDLQAELFAYRAALASLKTETGRSK
jgi:hypothetical protein